MSHAAPTDCMKVPTSETKSASSKLRKVAPRRGRHRLDVLRGGDRFSAVSVNYLRLVLLDGIPL